MLLYDTEFEIPAAAGDRGILEHVAARVRSTVRDDDLPLRFAITRMEAGRYHCELGMLRGLDATRGAPPASIFELRRRAVENTEPFTAVFVVPTGIGCEIGGHAGDATPAVRLIGSVCDRVITHPNAVNGADLNEMPPNALYVEGSVLARVLMGTAGLQPVRQNRVLVVIDERDDPIFGNSAVNAVNGARASAGLRCDHVATLSPRITMETDYSSSGRAAGRVLGFDSLCAIVERYRGRIDAVAITSVVDVDRALHDEYFARCGDVVNPWGGVEALLTHALSALYALPSAHSPMYESREIMNEDPGVMDPRVAAEGVSVAFLHCILRGLDRAPRIVADAEAMRRPGVVTAEDLSCLIIPDGTVGLPTLAALEQGIPVIAVRENANCMRNDLGALPWREGQLFVVDNYWEAAGVTAALRAGIAPATVRRPLRGAAMDAGQAPGDSRRRDGSRGSPQATGTRPGESFNRGGPPWER